MAQSREAGPWSRATGVVTLALVLVAAVGVTYFPAIRAGFIFDDDVFLTQNPLVHSPEGLRLLWFSREAKDYWPVTGTSLWLEWRLWGVAPMGYHATNVALHLTAVLLLWTLLRRLEIGGAFVAALLFAVHPVVAETVTWITERKNLLAMVFFLISLHEFVGALGGGPGQWRRRLAYTGSLLAFLLGMLSKSSIVILPAVLAGLVLWKRRPAASDLLRIAPFCLVGVGLVILQSQYSTVLPAGRMAEIGFAGRVQRAGEILWFYLGKAFWPTKLSFDYGPMVPAPGDLFRWLPLVLAAAVTIVLVAFARSGARPGLFAWGYFVCALIPVFGFIEVGFMRYSPVSDHFAHLAMLGACVFLGWVVSRIWLYVQSPARLSAARRTGAGILAGCVAVTAAVWSREATRQCLMYSQAEGLYRATLALNPNSWLCQCNLGVILLDRGEVLAAEDHLGRSVQLYPDFADAHNNLGVVYYREARLPEARTEYEAAVRLRPAYVQAHNNLGVVDAIDGRYAEALREFTVAAQIDPNYGDVRQNLDHIRALMSAGSSLHP